ncbi:hypothetical protein D3C80_1846740 [compost metagenome]
MHRQGWPALILQRPAQRIAVERLVHRITRLRMRQAKFKQLLGWQAGAGAPQRNARIGKGTQRIPAVNVNRLAHGCSPCNASNNG